MTNNYKFMRICFEGEGDLLNLKSCLFFRRSARVFSAGRVSA